MIGLYWDTATDWAVVEVLDLKNFQNEESKVSESLYLFREFRPKESSLHLVKWIQDAIQKANIHKPDWILVSQGPGSFTGIRIAVATARNLSQLWGIPCIGLDTMQLYREYYNSQEPDWENIVILKSNKNQYFIGTTEGTFDWNEEEIKSYLLSWKNQSQKQVKIHSLTNISWLEEEFPIAFLSQNFPYLSAIPFSFYRREFQLNQKEIPSYFSLTPKYMRETYASVPKQKTP